MLYRVACAASRSTGDFYPRHEGEEEGDNFVVRVQVFLRLEVPNERSGGKERSGGEGGVEVDLDRDSIAIEANVRPLDINRLIVLLLYYTP